LEEVAAEGAFEEFEAMAEEAGELKSERKKQEREKKTRTVCRECPMQAAAFCAHSCLQSF
jgi:hypothetical protein